ncbi:MAG: D-alanyl-D-alanine carboxypeptidase [Firmicutes bacterium]|nr:D-alanyl-D-alanine carboxypeptidase [Bacillota bacterium]
MIVPRIRKIITTAMLFFLFFCSLAVFSGETRAQEVSIPDLNSYAAVLMEFSRGEIIFSQNGSEILHPASLTKIMTLVLAYEALQEGRVSWEDKVTISQKAWETKGSQMFLEINDQVSFGDLVTGIAVVSANDACVAVGEYLCGSEALFVQEMNQKATELGLTNTLFQNSSGLPDSQHYTTAEDLAVLSRYLIGNFPEYLKLHSQKEFDFNGIKQYNLNPLLRRFSGADGLKTGHTGEAGFCLVGTAVQKGLRFITVVMKASSEAERTRDSENMLNYAFRNYMLGEVLPAKEALSELKVTGGEKRAVSLQLDQPLETVVPFNRQEDLETHFNVPQSVAAPIAKGDPLGSVEALLDGNVIAEAPLVAAEDVDKAGFFSLLFRSVGDFLAGLWLKFVKMIGNLLS